MKFSFWFATSNAKNSKKYPKALILCCIDIRKEIRGYISLDAHVAISNKRKMDINIEICLLLVRKDILLSPKRKTNLFRMRKR